MYEIMHLLDDNEKISNFSTETELIAFTKVILEENGDSENFICHNANDCLSYIENYCGNLQII